MAARITASQDEKIAILYTEDLLSSRQISSITGVAETTILYRLRAMGIKRRPPGTNNSDPFVSDTQALCTKCGEIKDLDQFVKGNKKNGRNSHCKICHAKRGRDGHHERVFDISQDEYEFLLVLQGGLCAICEGDNGDKRLCVDHCHDSGHIRGLLCTNCNLAIGYLNDKPDLCLSAYDYLRNRCRQ